MANDTRDGPTRVGAATEASGAGGLELPWLVSPLLPLINLVARTRAGVHAKLLTGFLIGALLLLGMGVFSLIVIGRMGQSVDELTQLQEKVDRSRQMIYAVTSQSHFRAMALLTFDDANNTKIANAKNAFGEHLEAVRNLSPPESATFLDDIREANDRYSASSEKVLSLYEDRNVDEALKLHLDEEHAISHELEGAMKALIGEATADAAQASDAFQSDKRFVTSMVWAFSGVSLAFAILVGIVMSWAFIRPVRKIESVVAGVAAGDFSQRADVPNRDEFGGLAENVNRMTQRLGNLHNDMQDQLDGHKRAEEELGRRSVEQVAVNNELDSLNYSVTYELGPGLKSIETSAQELIEGHAAKLDERGKGHLELVHATSQRIREVVDDTLNLSRVLSLGTQTGQDISRERVDLSGLARTVADELKADEPSRQVRIDVEDELAAQGDPVRLREALQNLIGNAWKFTSKQSEARIEFGADVRDGESVYFVRDDGAGFDATDADNLFQPFHRLHYDAEYEGVGIGLATVRRIVQSHGGRIWAEGAVGRGATFYFTLPEHLA